METILPISKFISVYIIFPIAAGLFSSILFNLIKNRKGKFHHLKWTLNIVTDIIDIIPNISIQFEGQEIERLSVSRLAFWNGTNKTIEYGEVASANPLRIDAMEHVNIVGAQIKQITNPGNAFNFKIKDDKKSAIIEFDYIEPKDGFVADIYHTGYWQSSIKVTGSVKRFGKIENPMFPNQSDMTRSLLAILKWPKLYYIFFLLALIISASVLTICATKLVAFAYNIGIVNAIFGGILFYGCVFFAGQVTWSTFAGRVPERLRHFESRWRQNIKKYVWRGDGLNRDSGEVSKALTKTCSGQAADVDD